MYKIKLFILLLLLAVLNFNTTAQGQVNTPNEDAQQKLNTVDKQFFIENKGQWPSEVLYLTQMGGLNTWITTKGMLYEFYKFEEIKPTATTDDMPNKFEQVEYKKWGHRVAYKLLGNNVLVKTQGEQKQEGYYNYLIGNDLSKHASNVGLYKEALVKDVYTGIDMRYYFDKGLLRYDYIVHPGADPNQIRFSLEGSDKTFLNEKGELVFTTCFGEVKNADLYCYQNEDKKTVNAKFIKSTRLEGGQGESWKITLEDYNKNQTLIIDPLIYSTYIGGSGTDVGNSITVNASENAYITGYTNSTNYDITLGVFQTTNGSGLNDVFVTKLNATGTALVYSTYIGGSDDDNSSSIVLDGSGNAYITGNTNSTNYDITSGAYQTTNGGNYDVFVTKLNTTGTALIYSTYIGGSNNDMSFSIVLDSSGNVYIAGSTSSINYDITSGAFQTTNGGGWDVFVTKLNPTGTALIYSTYIGGSSNEYCYSIAVDSTEYIHITGNTNSTNFNITPGVFQTTNAGGWDVFVTKLNSTGTALVYSTYIGGSSNEYCRSIVVDGSGNAYITGYTNSTNYDITLGSYQTTYGGGYDVFVSKLNAVGTGLVYSTYIGGSSNDYGYSIVVDSSGNAYITGYTNSTNYDITSGAYQTTNGGNYDVFVTKLNPLDSVLVYSTYIGGSSNDYGYSIVVDGSRNANITGWTTSTDYDITSSAFQTTNGGGYDVFVTKLNTCTTNTNTDVVTACDSITWIDGNTYFASTNSPTFILTNTAGCDSVVNLNLTINANSSTNVVTACDSITWIDGNTYVTSTNTPTYTLTNEAGCDSTVTLNLTINANSSTDVVTVCDSITWIDSITYTTNTNTPTFTLTNAAGCDSVVTLNLSVNNSNTGTDIQTACDSLTWINGITYTSNTNTPTFTLTNAAGCDSVVTLNLSVNNSNSSTDIQTTCDSLTWIDGITYTTSTNIPTFTLTNTTGCDSVVTLNLAINNSNSSTDVVTACDSITWIDGINYTANTNTPTFTLTNAAGCDSVITLNLTINSTSSTDVVTACDSITWIDGITYIASTNSPTFTLTNTVGCDSIVTLNLTINANSSTDVVAACDSIIWIDGINYTANTNTPIFTLTNAAGCDSVVTLNLTITNNDTSITQNINTLTVGETGATYQWLDCNNSNAIITGEINQSYIPASSGNYAVVVSKNGCTDTSACINFIITGISDLENPFVKISPNPTTAEFIIELASFSPKTQLSIVSVEGKIVYTTNTINTNKIVINAAEWSKGIYMVKITDKQSSQVVKLVKQ